MILNREVINAIYRLIDFDISLDIEKYKEIQRNTKKYTEINRNTKKYKEIEKYTIIFIFRTILWLNL
jgi:hypothetical protein